VSVVYSVSDLTLLAFVSNSGFTAAAAVTIRALRVALCMPSATPTPNTTSAMAKGAHCRMFWLR